MAKAFEDDCVPKDASTCSSDGLKLIDPTGEETDCSRYTCQGSACRTACSNSDECAPGFICDHTDKACVSAAGGGGTADDAGCGCRVPGGSSQRGALGLLLGLVWLGRRRRGRRFGVRAE